MRFRLSPVAELDILEITDYYTDITSDLADRFVSELETTLHGLCFQPAVGSRRYAHFLPDQSLRFWQMDHFPFLIFYRLDGDSLNIIRVLHERRDLSAHLITH